MGPRDMGCRVQEMVGRAEMSYTCLIDNTSHETLDALHAYVKAGWRLSQKSYWTLYAPRKDLCTGEPIAFKDAEQYLAADFANKLTLKRWLKEQPREVGLKWAKEWLAKRKVAKGLVYAPSQAELRTLCTPTMPYYESVAVAEGGYYGVTTALGFKSRYRLDALHYSTLSPDTVVTQDTREQAPVKLPLKTTVATLNVGDYAIAPPYDTHVRIERKSLSDFCGTLSARKVARKGGEDSAYARFDRELTRAAQQNLYVVMMVEANITDAQRFDYLPQTKWVKASPAYVTRNLRDLLVKHPLTFQVVFVDGRAEMAAKMQRIFELGAQVRDIDLQHAYEEGLL